MKNENKRKEPGAVKQYWNSIFNKLIDAIRVLLVDKFGNPVSLPFLADGNTHINQEKSNVSAGVWETLIDYTVPVEKIFFLYELELGGNAIAIFRLIINGENKRFVRLNFHQRNNYRLFFIPYKVNAGEHLKVDVYSYGDRPADFEANIGGNLLNDGG